MAEIPVRCRGVSAYVIRRDKDQHRTLLMHRTKTDSRFWAQVAGSIEDKETAAEAALREIEEETKLVPDSFYSADYCEQFYEIDPDSIWIAPVFVAFVSSAQQVEINNEHSEFEWLTHDEAMERLPFPLQRHTLKHIWAEFIERRPNDGLKIEMK